MRFLVTGAGGQLGHDVTIAARRAGHDVFAFAHDDLDITDAEAIRRAIEESRPDALVNCAAYTDVDGAEAEPERALEINGRGAGLTAQACAHAGVLIVHVSSDYVFDGRSPRPYVESDAPGPLSAYGRSKLAGEQAVAAATPDHAIVRSSWLFGVGGRNFVETMLGLGAERDEVGVVTDQTGCPTWTGHLAPALVAIAEDRALGLHHVAGGGTCSWNEFAVEIFRLAGVRCRVAERLTADLARPAPRPANGVLRSERDDTPRLAPWRDGLAAYLLERAGRRAAAVA